MSQPSPNSLDTVNAIFKPLDRAQKEIRLISLQPAFLETDRICCTLEHARLDDGPRYSALSWAWGDADQTESIILQGQEWQAPRNLVVALRVFRQKLEPWKTWIDAICINQSPDSEALRERGHQVQLMHAIYANSERVFAWVGESQPWTSDLFNCIRQLADPHSTTDRACAVIESVGREDHNDNLIFMKWSWDFATRPWWRRLWVLQEMVLAPQAVVVCGPHMILLDQVLKAFLNIRHISSRLRLSRADSNEMISIAALITTIEDLGRYGPSKLLGGNTTTSYPYQHHPKEPNDGFLCFSKLLTACRFRLSSDPRDKIYGLLGMTPDHVAMSLMPRYDKSVAEVYTETAFTLIERTGSLFILSQAQIALWRSNSTSPCTERMPSWVPDWSVERQGLGYSAELRCQPRLERARHFSACLRPRAEARLVRHRILQLRGFKVDSIAALHKVWEKRDEEYFPNLGFFGEWMRPNVDLGRSDAYVAGGTRINAYWRSWVHDMLPIEDFKSQDEGRPNQGRRCVKKFVQDCEDWRCSFETWKTLSSSSSEPERPAFPFPSLVKESTFTSIRFLLTRDKFLGLGNAMMQPSDMVYVLAGGSHPFVLRAEANRPGHYQLIGDCYIHGIMDGQALRNGYGPARSRRGEDLQRPGNDIWEDVCLV